MSRTAYIDNLKIILIIMVVLQHTAIASNIGNCLPVNLLITVNRVYLPCSFLLLSGYLAGPSFERKGAGMWLAGRVLLLGIPLFTGVLLCLASSHEYPGGRDVIEFLAILLLLDLAYFLCRLMVKRSWLSNLAVPAPHFILLFAIVLGIVCFLTDVTLACISYFILGTIAFKNNWLGFLSYKTGKRLGVEVLLLTLASPVFYFIPHGSQYGFHWQALLFSVWEQMMSISIIVSLICFAKKFLDRVALPERTAFVVFMIHPLVIAGLSSVLTNSGLNFFIIAPLAVAVSFLFAAAINRAIQTYFNHYSK